MHKQTFVKFFGFCILTGIRILLSVPPSYAFDKHPSPTRTWSRFPSSGHIHPTTSLTIFRTNTPTSNSTTSLCKKPINSHTTTSTIVVSLTSFRTNTHTPIGSTTFSTKKPRHSHTTASTIVASTNVPSSDVGKTNKIFVIEIIGGLGGLSGLLFCLAKWTAIVDSIA